MKFGRDFYRLQIPRWADAYLDYDGLKHLAKQKSVRNGQLEAFRDSLHRETADINDFLRRQHALINLWVEAVLSRFIISHASTFEVLDFAGVAQPELQDLVDCLIEILDFAAQLDVFSKINRDAIERLLGKLGCVEVLSWVTGSESPLYARPWTETSSRVQDLLQQVHRALELQADATELRSLFSPAMPSECLSRSVYHSISNDDSAALMCVMASTVSELATQAMLYSVLQVAIVYRSPRCIQSLLGEITSPLEEVLCGHRDPLHQFIAQLACRGRPEPHFQPAAVLEDMFRDLSPYQHHMLLTKDWRGRYPLHYAAEYGLSEVCLQILKFIEPSVILECDIAGETPLALAVCSGHAKVVQAFLELDLEENARAKSMISEQVAGAFLCVAIQSRSTDVAKCLIKFGKGLNWQGGKQGQTPLYIASRTGQVEVVEMLLLRSPDLNLNLPHASKKWTPLIVASVHGHVELVRLLLSAGANVNSQDWRGWSAIDHASYRAHMAIVAMVQHALCKDDGVSSETPKLSVQVCSAQQTAVHRPTSFAPHEALPDAESDLTSIFVNLGTFETHHNEKIADIIPSVANQRQHHNSIQSSMLLEVSGSDCREPPYCLQLPYLGDISDITWRFSTSDPDNMRLTFKLFQFLGEREVCKRLVGSGIALLSAIKGWFRTERQSLRRDSTVALMNSDGDFAGTLSFTFLVAGAYKPAMLPTHAQKMCPPPSTQIVAHRGLGLNEKKSKRLQIGEHTFQSLASALDQGADYIEVSHLTWLNWTMANIFANVQVTRDHVPVIYHDWFVSEAGLDVPIHAMTYRQWMALSEAQSGSHEEVPRGRLPWDERTRPSVRHRRDSRSLCARQDHPTKAMIDRMKHTFEYTNYNMKGNTRGDFIHDAFVTLRQLFEKFPENVSFDIELKYPMFWETDYWGMEPYCNEMNSYLDVILDVVYSLSHNTNRSIFFSCFNPEVCILLSTKQKTYPVVFLNDSMVSGAAGDTRATSLQQAVRFAKKWDLQGIIMAAETFVAAPKLIGHVKGLGLFCGSYGALNDVPGFAKVVFLIRPSYEARDGMSEADQVAQKQQAEGIDMIVVNNIRLISMALGSSSAA
ncbi:uncharacterized protein BCR38DRAFT_488398 [Pseudomassariella vexata]|uniref:Uncharacterized protein n=1 Tax=Pseudomassariella vexata TaxID=1141098 RepID=A0A1Y2DM54_9PEZI|nr:uncharacterized protein BCR38DRAFT_488398 [Pseudomassariella vexata]ORY60216.1 hypothetical protein BCR38DRAFT_488398 [Pseudomassariella vexata]